ncbi:response regulator [Mucilaginibacter aquariorum]|uniref:Response regulator n=1 Tax=Mucilaginibacter aquariorum TaxID=2967225 RepID=A0ABT1T4E1_9SPHI|nr:response regulator [Mucilaginibacter aquariorum]MCQ6959136.1 response regulator [Mucilaginibacter aquariorum]
MSKRILIIDDDEDILEILNVIFQEAGYEVILSNTGVAAGHIEEIRPDLVMLDIRIAGSNKSGTEMCRELKSNYETKNLPVMLISAEANLHQIAKDCAADAYISKPFDINDLLLQVKEYLS